MNCYRKILTLLVVLYTNPISAQVAETTVKEYKKTFTTYPFSDPNPIPDPKGAVYPYTHFDGYTNMPEQKEWKVVEIENPYIKVVILPEVGGKVWTAIEKLTNRPFIYDNQVIKFRNLGIRGPYTSGGIESNFGIMGHTANVATPMDYQVNKNKDGSVSCIIGTLDLLTRTTWRTEINIPKDKAYFTTRTIWYNNTAIEQPYYHWLNAGLPTKGNVEFLYPGKAFIGHSGELGEWPVNTSNKKKINFYENNDFGGPKSYHVLGQYANYTGAYWHDYKFGMIRYGARDGKAGKKLWVWGLSNQGMIWEDLLTNSDGQYWELQSGRQFNQNSPESDLSPFKHTAFTPYGTDTWTEYWYPILQIKGAVEANEYGALNLKYEDGWLKMYFSAVQAIDDVFAVKNGDQSIYRKQLKLAPMQVFKDSIKTATPLATWKANLGDSKLVYSFNSNAANLSRPLEAPGDFRWESAYGQYLLGKNLMNQKKFTEAEAKLHAALALDRNYLPALVAMSQLMYRNMHYQESLDYVRHALSIDTYAGDANYFYGLVNKQLGNTTDAKDGFDLATLTTDYRSAAYTELATIYLNEKNAHKAVEYAQKATDFNKYNMTALQLEAIAYRLLSQADRAKEVLKAIADYDQMSHFVNFEKYLWNNTEAQKQEFVNLLRGEMPQETYNELGVFYHRAGCDSEARTLFSMALPSAEATYWLSYLQHQKVDFSNINVVTSLPFRSETGSVMEQLLQSENNWKLKYQLALVYANKNRLNEAEKLLQECGNDPDVAPFYAFRAAMSDSSAHSFRDLQKAASLDNSWRVNALLAANYFKTEQPEKALLVIEAYYKQHPENFTAGFGLAKAYLRNGKYVEANNLLEKIDFIPAEGITEGQETYREVKLMLALAQMKSANYSKAQQFIDVAMLYPKKFGAGAPYENETDYRLEQWMSYRCYALRGKKKEASVMLQKIVDYTPGALVWGGISRANHLLTALAYDELGKHDKALYFIANESKNDPKLSAVYKLLWENKKADIDLIESSISSRVLEQLFIIEETKMGRQ